MTVFSFETTAMRKFLGTFFLIFALSIPAFIPAAVAQDDVAQQVEALSAEGAGHFRAGEYEVAIALFEEAYQLEPVPNLLFNIGRCYEQLEEWELAKEHFEKFITSPDVASEARQQAMNRVQSLNEIIAAEEAEEEEPQEEIAEEEEIEEIDQPNMLPGYAAAGTGGLLIVGGIVMGVMANGNAGLIGDSSLSYEQRLDAQQSARTQGIVADVFYVTGALATAAGIYLIFNARQQHADSQQVRALTPWIGRDGAGVGVHLDF